MDRKEKIALTKKYFDTLRFLDNETHTPYLTNLRKMAVADERVHRANSPSGISFPTDFSAGVAGKYFTVKWILDGVLKQHGTDIPATVELNSLLFTRRDALLGWAIGARYIDEILERFAISEIEDFLDPDQPDYSDMNREEKDE